LNIFNYFDSIISSIKREQYKDYLDQWRGRKPINDSDYFKRKEKFTEKYVADHIIDFDENKFIKEFKQKLSKDKDFRDKYLQDLEENEDEYLNKILTKYEDDPFLASFLNDFYSSSFDMIKAFMTKKDKGIKLSNIYKESILQAKTEYYHDHIDALKYDAGVEFENDQTEESKPVTKNVSVMYKKFFEELKDLNPLNTKYRVYFDINIDSEDEATSVGKNINNKKSKFNFSSLMMVLPKIIERYYRIKNKTEEADEVMNQALSNTKEFRKNYTEGYYYDPVSDRKERIGRMFQFVKQKDPDFDIYGADIENIEKMYIDRPKGFSGKVCISRHPRDIAAMSTDQGWTSCQDLNNPHAEFIRYVGTSITGGALIAYLVKDDDLKIDKPTSRLLIKPYVKKGEEMNYENPNWLLFVSDTYGTVYSKFEKEVQAFINKYWNSKIQGNESDEYEFSDQMYKEKSDSNSKSIKDTKIIL